MAKTLIEKGASRNYDGDTPLDVAKSNGHDSLVKVLENARASRHGKALLVASKDGDKEKVMELLAKGADIYAKDINGETPLHLASYKGHASLVKTLIGKGADVNAKNNEGETRDVHGFTTKYRGKQISKTTLIRNFKRNLSRSSKGFQHSIKEQPSKL